MQTSPQNGGRTSGSLIPPHGGYRHLKSFQVAQLVYDVTVRFCDRYIDRRSRTHDQMVQAARSGVQNIAEGSKVSGTSKELELKLTNVACASLAELGLDYGDYLRHRRLAPWSKEDPHRQELIDRRCRTAEEVARWVQAVHDRESRSGHDGRGGRREASAGSTASTLSTPSTESHRYSEIAANAALTLIAVATSLLDRQVASLARTFEREGGFRERLYRVRCGKRGRP
jgi:four helix bundle suffix protein